MRTTRSTWPLQGFHTAIYSLLICAGTSFAQFTVAPPVAISNLIPVVTIQATQPYATGPATPGIFTVLRWGNPAPPLHVYYEISGSASNGQDYQAISNWVDIPSGVSCGNIVVTPTGGNPAVTKTVVLTLTNSPLMGPTGSAMPVNYSIGLPSSATVYLTSGPVTNIPPLVSMVFPPDGATFYTPLNLPLVACAWDVDGRVVSVEFFANGVSLGTVSNSVSLLPPTLSLLMGTPPMPPYRPFILVWSNTPAGTNIVLTAKATDNGGATTVSEPVSITVHPGPAPTPTNCPPVVRITSPADGATFWEPVNIPIYAYAAERGGYITGVEFFAGTNDLGPGHRVTAVPPPLPPGPIQPPILIVVPTNYWELVWSNAPAGSYPLTAVAVDNLGRSTVSESVNVRILPPLPPPVPTNVVDIVALDPIAIEGTNCWPRLSLAGCAPTWANWTATASVWRYLTNCGPKNAVFAVRRFGETNADLVVSYGIGGTATNGVDYVPLPGTVTIPAGQPVGLVTVIPKDDGQPDITSTVILTLEPSTNYVVGRPVSAAAIILDAPKPTAVGTVLPDKTFHLRSSGPDGCWFHIEYSDDLLHWTPICTNQLVDGSIDFVDPDAPGNQLRFYRAVPEAGPPQ